MAAKPNVQVQEYYKSRNTMTAYLKNAGFDTSKYDNFSLNEIHTMKQVYDKKASKGGNYESNPMNMTVTRESINHVNEDGSSVIETCDVIYYMKPSIQTPTLENLVTDYYSTHKKTTHYLVLIINSTPSDNVMKFIKRVYKQHEEYVCIYDIHNLQFNVLTHDRVPMHRRMTDVEKLEVYNKYNIISDSMVPEIGINDPVAKAILLRPGELCEITRHNQLSLIAYYYRICVA